MAQVVQCCLNPAKAKTLFGLLDYKHDIDGRMASAIFSYVRAAGSLNPASHETVEKKYALCSSGRAGGF